MGRILEAGHYYQAKGPTPWAHAGWKILESIRDPDDKTVLFVDDVHQYHEVPEAEKELVVTNSFNPPADYHFLESAVEPEALEVLEALKTLPNSKRARVKDGIWHCAGVRLTHKDGQPLCVLLDAGLTLVKHRLGFTEGINILPAHYQGEQERLRRLIRRAIPGFNLKVVLFDLEGGSWELATP